MPSSAAPCYASGMWTLHEGSCVDPVTGLAVLADASVDHVITDPPYEAEAHTLQRRVKRAGGVAVIESLGFAPMTGELRRAVSREIARVVRRWVLVFCQVEAAMEWRRALENAGLVYKRTGVWVKPDGQPQLTGDRPGMGYESIVWMHRPGRSRWNAGGRASVYTFNKYGDGDRLDRRHETQKPALLMEALVRDVTDLGETVLDPFAGSGATGVAAVRLCRSFVGWEHDATSYALATTNLTAARPQGELLELPPRGPKPKQHVMFTAAKE